MSPRSARPETGRLGSRGGVSLSPDLLLPLPRHAQRHPSAHQEKRPRQPLECPTGEGKCERCPSQGRLSVRRPPLRAATVPPGPSEGLRPLPASLTPAITPRFPAFNWGGPRARGWGRGGERGSRLRSSPQPAGAEEIKAVPRRWPSAGGTSPGCPTPPGENKRRDLERDPAASNRSRMSWTQPPRLEGRRSWAGLPRPRPLGRGKDGRKSAPHVETSPPPPVRTGSFLALQPSFPPWKQVAFGRGVAFGGAGRWGRAQGGQRANGCPRKPVSGPPQVARWAGASTQAGQGQGQRPRAGQGPSRGPAAAPLAGASQAPGGRGRGVYKSPVSRPQRLPPARLTWGAPGPSRPGTGL